MISYFKELSSAEVVACTNIMSSTIDPYEVGYNIQTHCNGHTYMSVELISDSGYIKVVEVDKIQELVSLLSDNNLKQIDIMIKEYRLDLELLNGDKDEI